jgi:hypothetical protein
LHFFIFLQLFRARPHGAQNTCEIAAADPRSFLYPLIVLYLNRFQNPVGFETGFRKSGLKPVFSFKSKEAVPKAEVLEQPHFTVKRRFPNDTILLFIDFF